MKLVYIYGPPAVGKLEVAKQLAKITGFRLFHNHLTADYVSSIFPLKDKISNKLKYQIAYKMLEAAALYIAENKRTQNGEVLYQATNIQYELRKDFLRALKKANPSNIYVNSTDIPYLKEKARKIKKRRYIEILTSLGLVACLGLTGFLCKGRISNYLKEKNTLRTEVSRLEGRLKEKSQEFEEISEKYKSDEEIYERANYLDSQINEKRVQLSDLELQIDEKGHQFTELDRRVNGLNNEFKNLESSMNNKRAELKNLNEQISSLEEKIEEKESYNENLVKENEKHSG